jgi:hypothetical protein
LRPSPFSPLPSPLSHSSSLVVFIRRTVVFISYPPFASIYNHGCTRECVGLFVFGTFVQCLCVPPVSLGASFRHCSSEFFLHFTFYIKGGSPSPSPSCPHTPYTSSAHLLVSDHSRFVRRVGCGVVVMSGSVLI